MKNSVQTIYAANRWNVVSEKMVFATSENVMVVTPILSGTALSTERKTLISLIDCHAHLQFNPHDSIESMTQMLQKNKVETISHIVWLGSSLDIETQTYGDDAHYGEEERIYFRLMKSLLKLRCDERKINMTLMTKNNFCMGDQAGNTPVNAGLHGFAGAAAKEYSHWVFHLLDVDDDFIHRATLNHRLILAVHAPKNKWSLKQESLSKKELSPNETVKGQTYCCRQNHWYEERLEVLPEQEIQSKSAGDLAPAEPLYRDQGVYLVIGGAGGLGQVWTEHLLKNYDAQVIWIGRRPINHEIQKTLDAMENFSGPSPLYLAVDATSSAAMAHLQQTIQHDYGRLDGIIHSAIVLEDKSIANMSEDIFHASLSAKVDTCRNIERYFTDFEPDFIAFYSSIQSFSRQAGQSNYAAGCTFKDSFAHYLQAKILLRAKGLLGDKRLSGDKRLQRQVPVTQVKVMNWGYWGTVGIVSDVSYQQVLEKSGMASIRPSQGMAAFDDLIATNNLQASFIAAYEPEKITLIDSSTLINKKNQHQGDIAFRTSAPSKINQYMDENLMIEDIYQNDYYITLRKEGVFYLNAMDNYLCQIIWAELATLGVFSLRKFTVEDVIHQAGIQTNFARWMTETFMNLVRHGYLHHEDGVFWGKNIDSVMDANHAWASWDRVKADWLTDEHKMAQVRLVETMLRHIKEILTGKIKATDVMFPNSSMTMVEGIYKHNRVADYFNLVLSTTVINEIKALLQADPGRKIRILEVGAGTGGTTAVLLQHLQAYHANIEEYCYTDLSKSFLFHAQKEYGLGNPFLSYKIFNVEKPIDEQNIQPDSYDIAIATNVLHATHDIAVSIRHVKTVLKEHGVLIINELSRNALFNHLTFGFLDGWWLYHDEALRIPGSPALEPETWHKLALQEGYGATDFPAIQAHDMGQFVMSMRAMNPQKIEEDKTREVQSAHTSEHHTLKKGNNAHMHTKQQEDHVTVKRATLKEKSRLFFISLIAEVVQLPVDEISASLSLEKLGFDSILVVQLTNKFREYFDEVSSSLLFDIESIEGIIDYFIENDEHALAALVGVEIHEDHKNDSDHAVTEAESGAEWTVSGATSPMDIINLGSFSDKSDDGLSVSLPQKQESHELIFPENQRSTDIAIIGLSGIYPGARTLNEFWENISHGRNMVTSVPEARWEQTAFSQVKAPENMKGGFIDGFDEFDADFFGMSAQAAVQTDPQERKFLECAFSAVEDAGYTQESLLDNEMTTGVYVGVMYQEYQLHSETAKGLYEGQAVANTFSSIANRVSYTLNLNGPSIAVDSMCSSSLSAMHLACSALKLGEIDYAIAGGVNLTLHPNKYRVLKQGGDLSSAGFCASFSEDADGYVPSEGVGAVVLKCYQDALRDGDHIYGVIRGSQISHSGKTNGYTVPSPKAYRQLISKVIRQAGIHSSDISYIEAHGTGTDLGDAIEIDGLKQAFSLDQHSDQQGKFCSVGSVKSNIGHGESAAGMAGLTKILLQLKHQQIAPSIHSTKVSKNIHLGKTPFSIPQSLSYWRLPHKQATKRIAGLSSFGAGGANAHFIIEEHEEVSKLMNYQVDKPEMIVLSAQSKAALFKRAEQLLEYIQYNVQQNTALNSQSRYWLCDIAYTLQVGRAQMPYRLGFLADSIEDLEENLTAFLAGKKTKGHSHLHVCYASEMDATAKMLYADNSIQLILSSWLKEDKYQNIVSLWSKGITMNWGELLGQHGQRISLPTYPFAQNRYWLSMDKIGSGITHIPAVTSIDSPEKQASAVPTMTDDNVGMDDNVGQAHLTDEKSLCVLRWRKMNTILGQRSVKIPSQICVLGIDTQDYFQQDLADCSRGANTQAWLQILPDVFAQSFSDLAKSVARQLAKKLKIWLSKKNEPLHLQIIIPGDRQSQLYASLVSALQQSVAQYQTVKLSIIYCDVLCSFDNVCQLLQQTPPADEATVTEYLCSRDDVYQRSFQPIPSYTSVTLLNDHCVYVLANGFHDGAEDIIHTIDDETSGCHIAILGSEHLESDAKEKIETLQKSLDNTKVSYYPVALEDRKSVFNTLLLVKDQLGEINGIHYVLTNPEKALTHKMPLKDKSIIHHLSALMNLDEATYSFESPLQLFSILRMENNAADDRQLNSLLNAFGRYRSALQNEGYRQGKTITLDINSRVPEEVADAFIRAMDQIHGDETYAFAWQSTQFLDANASLTDNEETAGDHDTPSVNPELQVEFPQVLSEDSHHRLVGTVAWLISLSSDLLNRAASSFNPKATFIENGYESMNIVALCELLNAQLNGSISVVVFFEHETIELLAAHLLSEYDQQIEDVLEEMEC